MDGVPALDMWDVVIEVLHSRHTQPTTTNLQTKATPKGKSRGAAGNCVRENVHNISLKKEGDRNVDQLSNLDHVATNANSSQCKSQQYIVEDNEAVIKMIIKGRSPVIRHVSGTHRVTLDLLFDRINLDPKIQIKYVDTKKTTRRHVY